MNVELQSNAVTWPLEGSLSRWVSALPLRAAAAIDEYCVDCPPQPGAQEITIPANVVATWPELAAVQLGLPENCPLPLDLRLSGTMGRPGAQIQARWLQPGKTIPAKQVKLNGLWLEFSEKCYRIPSPLYEILDQVEEFNNLAEAKLEDQFLIWARMRKALGDKDAAGLSDHYLRALRIMTASALTFAIRTDAAGALQLDPVLLIEEQTEGEEEIHYQRVLSPSEEDLLPDRLDALPEGTPAFPLSPGSYVVVDSRLQKALSAVKTLRRAPPEERKRAAMHPELVLRELMEQDDFEPSVFIETESYADRVLDVGEWIEPVLPWIKISPMNWGDPGSMGVRIGGVDIPLQHQSLQELLQDMKHAAAEGRKAVSLDGQQIPVSAANIAALEELEALWMGPPEPGRAQHDSEAPDAPQMGIGLAKHVLIIETNFEDSSFTRTIQAKRNGQITLPAALKTEPKKHQNLGISWLQRHWVRGSRGAMLCDDMGLGKTFQALAFCSWLREQMASGVLPRKPLLIIAPVGLLKTWEEEIRTHLLSPGLGTCVRAYGEHLRTIKRGRHLDGTANLDTTRLSEADVVLANYETVSAFQLNFGTVHFAAVVLDEAQKIKSPKARVTHALKGLNMDFTLAMTGTPVENRLADLWSIADAVQPGALPDLKEFSTRYETEASDVQDLRRMIWQEEEDILCGDLKMMLRRMKHEKLDGLPIRHVHQLNIPMPPIQQQAYLQALSLGRGAGPGSALKMIQSLRKISLHPDLMAGRIGSKELNIEESARFTGMMQFLDSIAETSEKVLVFIDSLQIQDSDQLPMLLQRRYDLARSPMVINGQVSTSNRQARVTLFQQEEGFDIMLLSPKAAGVGLTLTAANHVIHLSRWWNPAVEDQCSDRVYRIGQNKPVHVYYPMAVYPGAEEHSFDTKLHALMERKRALAHNLLAAPALTGADFEQLAADTLIIGKS